MLPGCRERGSTVPEKRSTSTFWFTPICFSPASTRCPLGNTPTTVAVIEPENVLALAVAPSPEKSLAEPAPMVSLGSRDAGANGIALTLPDIDVVRLAVLDDVWLAVAATDDRAVNQRVAEVGNARRLFKL